MLDTQYVRVDGFGRAIPQRRRRVFVVGNLGDWRSAAKVLFDSESLSRNPPARGKTGEVIAGTVASCFKSGGKGGIPSSRGENLICMASTQSNAEITSDISTSLVARQYKDAPIIYASAGFGQKIESDIASVLSTNHDDRVTGNNAALIIEERNRVRRLTPLECERLMGFPDYHTRIKWRGKSEENCPDSPRYKACGNSMSVNCMRWIGRRIEMVEREDA